MGGGLSLDFDVEVGFEIEVEVADRCFEFGDRLVFVVNVVVTLLDGK